MPITNLCGAVLSLADINHHVHCRMSMFYLLFWKCFQRIRFQAGFTLLCLPHTLRNLCIKMGIGNRVFTLSSARPCRRTLIPREHKLFDPPCITHLECDRLRFFFKSKHTIVVNYHCFWGH